MTATPKPYRRAMLLPLVVGTSLLLLGAGVAASDLNGNLTAATPADKAAAAATFEPATGRDVLAALPGAGEVGGAGAIEPADRPVSLSPETSGVVAEVLVAEGDPVEAGQLLVRLRDETELAEVAGAEADVRAASSDLAAARADAAGAVSRAALSRSTADRTSVLAGRSAATPDELDRAALARDADAAAADAARARVAQATARLSSVQARLALSEARLAQTRVRAPAAGEVLQLLTRAGEAASPGAALVVMGDTRHLRARIDVNERDALRVKVGQAAQVRVEGAADPIVGRVVEVGRRVGRKNVRTEDPTDRQDVRFVETVIALETSPRVPMGIRVQGYITVE